MVCVDRETKCMVRRIRDGEGRKKALGGEYVMEPKKPDKRRGCV
jgi:hypothetical protein